MKIIFLSLALVFTIKGFSQDKIHPIDIENKNCLEQALPTTIGSINCEKDAVNAWKAEMEKMMHLLKTKANLLDVELLEETQIAWLSFHKTQVQFYYSHFQIQYQGGTMARAAAVSYEKRHLRERVLFLEELYEEIIEQ